MTPPRDETALIAELRDIASMHTRGGGMSNLLLRAAEALDAANQDTVRAARAYNESLDNLIARLRVVEQERDALKQELDALP